MHASGRWRRVGFGGALATGLALIGMSFGGMASLDGELRAAAEQTPSLERVNVDLHKGKCDRDERRVSSAGRT